MRKFKATDRGEQYITFSGVEYAFIVRKNKIGVRRMDQKPIEEKLVDKITEYLITEGWAEHLNEDKNE
jgi:hypothetical protein